MGYFRRRLIILIITFIWSFCAGTTTALAAPYYFVSGSSSMIKGYGYQYQVYLYTDASTVTAAQTVLNFNSNYISAVSAGNINSRCNFWAPADPSLGYGNTSTPYFYSNNKLVLSCGFSNPGYASTTLSGDLIATLTLTPHSSVSATTATNLFFSDTLFKYIGQTVAGGTNSSLNLTVYASTDSASPSITPHPSPTPVNPTTITADSLNLVNLSSMSGSTNTATGASTALLEVDPNQELSTIGNLDNTIPAPPDLSPRPTITPFIPNEEDEDKDLSLGEVLSLQSLRELLLPGKSDADQRVVMVNLLSTIAFLVILTILLWRLIMIARMNKLKNRHLNEILQGELSALESKLSADLSDSGKTRLNTRMEELRQELEKDLK